MMPSTTSSSVGAASTSTSTTTTTATNANLSALTRELLGVCLQHTASSSSNTNKYGTLATGGLGIWTYLQYQLACHDDYNHHHRNDDDNSIAYTATGERQSQHSQPQHSQQHLLLAARDAALEALRALEGTSTINIDDGISRSSITYDDDDDTTTAGSPLSSMSLYTNPHIGCHCILAAIHHQLQVLQIKGGGGDIPPDTAMIQQDNRQRVQYHIQQVLTALQEAFIVVVGTRQHHPHNHSSDASLWTGMAGGIQTILFLRQQTQNPYVGQELIVRLAQHVLLEGRSTAMEYQQRLAPATLLPPHGTTTSKSPFPTLLWQTTSAVAATPDHPPFHYDLGMQHGLVGILITLLALTNNNDEWEAIETVSPSDNNNNKYYYHGIIAADTLRHGRAYIQQTITALPQVACHVSSGNLRTQLGNVLQDLDRHVSVAYGAPGHILLLLSAYHAYHNNNTGDDRSNNHYLQLAQQLAEEVVWARRIVWSKISSSQQSGLGLLRGMTGNAYVLLQLSQTLSAACSHDGDESDNNSSARVWKYRAEHLARHAVQHWRELLAVSSQQQQQDASSLSVANHMPYSLMEGLGGLVSLLIDLNNQSSNTSVQFPLIYQRPSEVFWTRQINPCPQAPPTISLASEASPEERKSDTSSFAQLPSSTITPARPSLSPSRQQHESKIPTAFGKARRHQQLLPGNSNPPPSSPMHDTKNPIVSNTRFVAVNRDSQGRNRAILYDEEDQAQIVLDKEIHHKTTLTSIDTTNLDEDDEFRLPNPEDVPNEQFLRYQMSFDDNNLLSYDNNESSRQHSNPQLLDEEDHKLVKKQEEWSDEVDGFDEFQESLEQDAPDQRFLRLQDTDDEDATGDEFYAQDGAAINPSVLDDEGHVANAVEQKNGQVLDHDVSGVSDFATADYNEKPDRRFLQLQESEEQGGKFYTFSCVSANPQLLDEEGHAVADLVHTSLDLDDLSDFHGPTSSDGPDELFLQMQDSNESEYYMNRGAGQNIGILDEEDLLRNNRRIIAASRDEAEIDAEEFIDCDNNEMPVENYLRSQDSADEMYFQYDVKEHPPLIDEEAHFSPVENKKQYSSEWSMSDEEFSEQDYNIVSYRPPVPRSSSEHSTDLDILEDDDDVDEFQIPDVSDEPNINFLRANMSSDEFSMEHSNGHHQESAARLDEDGHQSLDMEFLQISAEYDDSEGSDEFGETDADEVADSRYLHRQDSANDQYFEQYGDQERLLEVKKNVRLLAKEAADKASKKSLEETPRDDSADPISPVISSTPIGSSVKFESKDIEKSAPLKKTCPSISSEKRETGTLAKLSPAPFSTPRISPKKKGKRKDFKKVSPLRATTAAISTFSPVKKLEWSQKPYLDLANTCFKNAKGQGSLLNGGIGISVYLRLRMSELETESKKKDEYLQSALQIAKSAVDDSKFDDGERKYMSMISNDALSSQCLLVSIHRRLGNNLEAREVANGVVDKIEEMYESNDKHDCSLLFGLSGALQAIWFLRYELHDPHFGSDAALTISSTVLLEGLEHSGKYHTKSLLMWEWHGRPFLGAGTGAVGVLYTLLGHNDEEWDTLNECLPRVFGVVRQCIDCLSDHVLESGNLKAAIDGFEEDKSTDWTHGAPGYCLLLIKAYEVYGDIGYLNQAQQMADKVIWPRRMQRRGLGLSRGVAGVAYVLLALARVDEENAPLWRARALNMAQRGFENVEELQKMSKNPYSLFEGIGGLVSLLVDLESSKHGIFFPLIEHTGSQRRMRGTRSSDREEGAKEVAGNGFNRVPKNQLMNGETVEPPFENPNSRDIRSPPSHGGQIGEKSAKLHPMSVERTVTTAATTSARSSQFKTPPRSNDGLAVSPLTEPSPGISSKSPFPLTEAKIRSHQNQRNIERVFVQEHRARASEVSPRVRPPKVKRHMFTHPLNIRLANHPTASWLAKQTLGGSSVDSMESFDIFTRASNERRLRAEASWLKVNGDKKDRRHVVLEEVRMPSPSSTKKGVSRSSVGRLVEGFSPLSSSHRAVEESVDEKMAHVMEELSERLEDMEMIM